MKIIKKNIWGGWVSPSVPATINVNTAVLVLRYFLQRNKLHDTWAAQNCYHVSLFYLSSGGSEG